MGSETKTKKKLSWRDATILMKRPSGPKASQEHDLIMALSKAFDIPPQGINILKDKPYINTVGLEWKLSQHPKALKFDSTIHIKIHKQVGDTAVAKTAGIDEHGGFRSAIGTANAKNMNMILGYPNELAETRALNRLLRRVLIPYLYGDLMKNLEEMTKKEKATILEIVGRANFGSVSSEEMNTGKEPTPEVKLTESEMKAIAPMLGGLNVAKSQEDLDEVSLKVEALKKAKALSEPQLEKLRTTFANVRKSLNLV